MRLQFKALLASSVAIWLAGAIDAFGVTYNVPPDSAWPIVATGPNNGDVVVGNGDVLNVGPGASLGVFNPPSPLEIGFVIGQSGSAINITGGFIDPTVVVQSGATLDMSGGVLAFGVRAESGSDVSMTGGQIAFISTIEAGAQFEMGGTAIGNHVKVIGAAEFVGGDVAFLELQPGGVTLIDDGSVINGLSNGGTTTIRGGEIAEAFDLYAGSITMAGGDLAGRVNATGGTLNLIGTLFFLNGVPVNGLSSVPTVITARNVNLAGLLADGTGISIDLSTLSNLGGPNDHVSALATVTLTQVPEPTGFVSCLALTAFILHGGRRRILAGFWAGRRGF